MPYQRNSFMDRLGSDKAVTLGRAVLIGSDGKDEHGHGERMRERWLMEA